MKCFKKFITLLLAISLCMSNSVAFAEMSNKQNILEYFSSKSESDRETTEIIVSFSNNINSISIENIIENTLNNTEIAAKTSEVSDTGVSDSFSTEVEKVLSDNTVLIKTNNIDAALEILNSNEDIIYAQPNYRLYIASDEPLNNKLWAIENNGQIINGTQGSKNVDLNIPAAWEMTRGSEDIVVAVLDTGIDTTHTTLSENIWINPTESSDGTDNDENGFVDDVNGWDFVNNDSSVFDNAAVDEHGTHMAGIIAGNGQNGVYGVAPDIKLMPLKVMEDNSGYTSDIIEAINYAEENGAKIVNCSFSGLEHNPALEDAISTSNMLFVTAVGNYASNTDDIVSFPACYECKNIISVGASDNQGNVAALSSYGNLVDVYAPGIGIYSTVPNNQYDFKDGTSCSAAYVSGIASLLYSTNPDLSAKQVKEAICIKQNNDETEMQELDSPAEVINAESVLNFDFVNSKSSMPELIDSSTNVTEREKLYPFAFYDNESGIQFILEHDDTTDGVLAITKATETNEAESIFYSELSTDNNVVNVSNISDNIEYNFSLTYTKGTIIYNYYGNLKRSFIEDEDKYLTETYNVVTNTCSVEAVANVNDDIELLSIVTENESNNTMGLADSIGSDDDVYGTISSTSDVDWYKIKFSSSGVANFWLGNVPSSCNYQLELYNSSGTWLNGSYNAVGKQELISFYSVSASTYYIKVYTANGYSSSQYLFRAKWYPSPDSYESNDSFSSAVTLSNGGYRYANINHSADEDFFKFTLTSKSYVEVSLDDIPTECWYNMEVFSGANENDFMHGAYQNTTAKQFKRILNAGTYYIKIYAKEQEYYDEDEYKISLNYCTVKSMSLSGSTSGSVGSSKLAAYTFSTSSQCGSMIELTGVSSSDYDLYLYKVSGSSMTEVTIGDSASKTGETISATLSSGDYILIIRRYSGTETTFTLNSSSTTTSNAAEISLSGFPSTMIIGDTKAVTITVKNLGMNTWTKSSGYKLSCLNDAPSFMSSELALSSYDEIQYGQTKTFSVNLTAPSVSTTQDYTLSFRMKKNSSLFGTSSQSKVITVIPEFDSISAGNTKTISGVSEKYYKLTVSSAANYVLRTMKYSTKYDTKLYLYDSEMNQIAYNDDTYSNYYSKIEKYLTKGTYYVYVKPYSGSTVQCYLNVETYSDQNVSTSVNVSNKYEGYYKYTVSTAGTYVFSTKRYSRDCDTYLILLDENGNVIDENNDYGSVYAKIETELSKGTYYIRVSSYKYIVNGENAKTYCTLTVGSKSSAPSTSESASVSISTPSSSGVIKVYNGNSIKISGSASNCSGVTVKVNGVTISGVKLNGSKYEVYYTPTESGQYTISVVGNAIFGSNPSANKTVTVAVNDDSDDLNSATAINSGTERVAAIDFTGDTDCFSFMPAETASYKIYSSGNVNLKGILYENDKVTTIGTSYDAPESVNFKLARTLEKNKTYYVEVCAESNNATGKYSIIIEKIDEPDDTYFKNQWGIFNIGSFATASGTTTTKIGYDINVLPVWEYTKGDGITIGVIDSGVDYNHDDLKDNLILPGKNTVHKNNEIFPSDEDDVFDSNGFPINTAAKEGHGTHVSGIIAAIGNNNEGVIGVAPEAKILPIKSLGNNLVTESVNANQSSNDTLLDGIEYAVNQNVDIINMSLQHFEYSDEIRDTINAASDTLFVICAGNDGEDLDTADTTYQYPGMYDCSNMITVAAMSYNGDIWSDSNYNGTTQIAAPGDMVLSTFPLAKDPYVYNSGTSMATPHVSGVAALIWSYYKDLSAAQVKQRIIDVNNVSYNKYLNSKVSSNGYLNAWQAFSNPVTIPQSVLNDIPESQESIQENKERITAIKNSRSDDCKTTKIFVKGMEDECVNIINELLTSFDYEIVKQYSLSKAYLLSFNSVQDADRAIDILNANVEIKYATPSYIINMD